MKLHLGCGSRKLDGFVNIDLYPSPAVDQILDIRRLPFKTQTIDLIYSSHVLEHFPHGEVPLLLKSWGKLLSAEGRMICVLPNFDVFVDWYALSGKKVILESVKNLFLKKFLNKRPSYKHRTLTHPLVNDLMGGGLFPKIDLIPENYHKSMFNPRTFGDLAHEAGFQKIRWMDLKKEDPTEGVHRSELHWSSMAFELSNFYNS